MLVSIWRDSLPCCTLVCEALCVVPFVDHWLANSNLAKVALQLQDQFV